MARIHSVKQIFKNAGLYDWHVLAAPVYDQQQSPVPGARRIYRSDSNYTFGLTTSEYVPNSHEAVQKFCENFLLDRQGMCVSATSFNNGAELYVELAFEGSRHISIDRDEVFDTLLIHYSHCTGIYSALPMIRRDLFTHYLPSYKSFEIDSSNNYEDIAPYFRSLHKDIDKLADTMLTTAQLTIQVAATLVTLFPMQTQLISSALESCGILLAEEIKRGDVMFLSKWNVYTTIDAYLSYVYPLEALNDIEDRSLFSTVIENVAELKRDLRRICLMDV